MHGIPFKDGTPVIESTPFISRWPPDHADRTSYTRFDNSSSGDATQIDVFYERNYGVTFPMLGKIDVKDDHAHPLYRYLTDEASNILALKATKWNFAKFLIDREGRIVKRHTPSTKPEEIAEDIEKLL